MTDEEKKLYHERQRLQLCGLHALNSLFQKRVFTKQALDSIVHQYDKSVFFNEYSSFVTGNYDLRIMIEALNSQGYILRAIDPSESLDTFSYKDCFGLLLNITVGRPIIDHIPILCSLGKPGRHWLSIKSLDGEQYYNFDSKLSHPKLIGDQNDLIEYLSSFDRAQTYIYIVLDEKFAEKFEAQ